MEREPPVEKYRVMRAIRSLAYNRELKPVIDGRIERAETKVRGFMLVNGLTSTRIGAFQIDMDEDGDLELERLQMDEWQQLSIPRVNELQRKSEEEVITEEPTFIGSRIERTMEPI